jgi:Dyp-type peroxidase family
MGTQSVEWSNVQGLVLSGYKRLRCAAYLLFRFSDPEPNRLSRGWLWRLSQRITNAEEKRAGCLAQASAEAGSVYAHNLAILHALTRKEAPRPEVWALNLALTPSGLAALGARADELARFATEFQQGMAPPDSQRRSNILGDTGESAPAKWRWGSSTGPQIDGLLLLYAADVASLDRLIATELAGMRGVAELVACHNGRIDAPPEDAPQVSRGSLGHFGFVDGISQPVIAGTRSDRLLGKRDRDLHTVPAGDFVLGYEDARGAVVSFRDPNNAATRDLARNGTYLVARQLVQDVARFEDFVAQAAMIAYGNSAPATRDLVAAKMLGRWPDGTPLVPPPALSGAARNPDRNDFLFAREDADGLGCPLGAHVRRANPRDVMTPKLETALRLSRMHRILRRGRPYGMLGAPTEGDNSERGLFFICLNASIANQFELVQHSWINNPAFAGLDGDIDPLSHVAGGDFTIQARPFNIRLPRPEPFVTVRGGTYFFMPGLNALRQLCA